MRFASFDIETTNLRGSYGRLLCCCFKFFDERKVRTVIVESARTEGKSLEEIAKHIEEAHVLVGWNSQRFDMRFLRQRAITLGTRPMPDRLHLDLLPHHRYYFNSAGHSLRAVGIDLRCKASKYEVAPEAWVLAANGDKDSLMEIVKHCEEDVKLTEEVHWKLAPYIRNIHR